MKGVGPLLQQGTVKQHVLALRTGSARRSSQAARLSVAFSEGLAQPLSCGKLAGEAAEEHQTASVG